MFTQKTSYSKIVFIAVAGVLFFVSGATSYAKPGPTPVLQESPNLYQLYPISVISATQVSTATQQTPIENTSPQSTLTPVEQSVVNDYVTAGYVPTDAQLKKFPPLERQKIIAEVIHELQLKLGSQTQQNTQQKDQGAAIFHDVFSEYGLQILALIISLFGVILAVSGFSMASSKKKKHISKFMNDIDDAFNSYKWKSKRCEAELYRLHDMIEDKLKGGQLDESSYQLLSSRIEKYLKEIQEVDVPKNVSSIQPSAPSGQGQPDQEKNHEEPS